MLPEELSPPPDFLLPAATVPRDSLEAVLGGARIQKDEAREDVPVLQPSAYGRAEREQIEGVLAKRRAREVESRRPVAGLRERVVPRASRRGPERVLVEPDVGDAARACAAQKLTAIGPCHIRRTTSEIDDRIAGLLAHRCAPSSSLTQDTGVAFEEPTECAVGVLFHVAAKARSSAIDHRTTRRPGYAISRRVRKRVEEIFGWLKSAGSLRKPRRQAWFVYGRVSAACWPGWAVGSSSRRGLRLRQPSEALKQESSYNGAAHASRRTV